MERALEPDQPPSRVQLPGQDLAQPLEDQARATQLEERLGQQDVGGLVALVAWSDPLQERAAELTGKRAAVFVASGTMGNLVALLTHCGRGDEVILGDRSHTFLFEQGGTTLRDFQNEQGKPGYFAQQLLVYGREGEPCHHEDGGTIRRIVQGGRSTWFCPVCQR